MKLLKKIPFFLFLMVLFFCLHGSVEDYGFLELGEVLMVGTVILVSVALFFGFVFLILRNYVLASLITFFISLWYLFFGAFHDWIKSHAAISFISSYSVLLPLLLAASILFFILLKRNKAFSLKLFFYLNVLLLIYCVVDSALLLNKLFTPQNKSTQTLAFDYSKVTEKPNVYFLLFDEYAGYKSLKDSFAFANDSLYSFFKNKQFSTIPFFSNYNFTLFSMSSILNMKYVDKGYHPTHVSQHDFQIRTREIRDAEVFSIFKKMGYHINNYSLFDIGKTHRVANQNAFFPVHSVLLTDKILHNRIIRTSGWLFQTGKLALPSWRKKYLYQHENNNLISQKMLIGGISEKNAQPKFCYAHFIMPHWPYYRDSTGVYNSDEILAKSRSYKDKALYLSYLKYTNTVIKSLVNNITDNDTGAVVIIMSDHGFRAYNNKIPFEPFYFDNICAVRLPGKYYPALKEKRSAVNLFRYLFNEAYGQNFHYLKDSSIALIHD